MWQEWGSWESNPWPPSPVRCLTVTRCNSLLQNHTGTQQFQLFEPLHSEVRQIHGDGFGMKGEFLCSLSFTVCDCVNAVCVSLSPENQRVFVFMNIGCFPSFTTPFLSLAHNSPNTHTHTHTGLWWTRRFDQRWYMLTTSNVKKLKEMNMQIHPL